MNSPNDSGFAQILRKREERPACGGGRGDEKDYDLGLHIMALFVVLFQSTSACAFPLIAKRFPALRIPPVVLFIARHFGTGVLIATAFVHLLPTAFISLLDPCLPEFWTDTYPAMPGAIAMAAVFFVTTIEMVFTRGQMKEVMAAARGEEEEKRNFGDKIKGAGKDMGIKLKALRAGNRNSTTSNGDGQENARPETSDSSSSVESGADANASVASGSSDNIGGVGGVGKNGFGMVGRRRSRSLSISKGMRDIEAEQTRRHIAHQAQRRTSGSSAAGVRLTGPNRALDTHDEIEEIFTATNPTGNPLDTSAIASPSLESAPSTPSNHSADPFSAFNAFGHSHHSGPRTHTHAPIVLTHAQKLKRAKLQVMLLEMGILFHSIFIGMALSVTSGSSFIVLLIAILFHQTFEGLALGSRIAVIPWEIDADAPSTSGVTKYQPWLMALAYGLTTPIGQAIGLGLQKVYDPASETGLLLVGTMNAVSSGLLLYAGLVELLAEDFLSDESWMELKGRKRVTAAFCVLGGAAGMSLIGAWA